jgi:hypothetical protein
MDKKVFISYSDKDITYANLLSRALKKKGVEVFSLDEPLLLGMDWDNVLRKEIKESSAFIPLISNNWSHSNWAATEYGAAHALGKKIIPVVIEDFQSNLFLDMSKFLTVDGKNADLETVVDQVEKAIQ